MSIDQSLVQSIYQQININAKQTNQLITYNSDDVYYIDQSYKGKQYGTVSYPFTNLQQTLKNQNGDLKIILAKGYVPVNKIILPTDKSICLEGKDFQSQIKYNSYNNNLQLFEQQESGCQQTYIFRNLTFKYAGGNAINIQSAAKVVFENCTFVYNYQQKNVIDFTKTDYTALEVQNLQISTPNYLVNLANIGEIQFINNTFENNGLRPISVQQCPKLIVKDNLFHRNLTGIMYIQNCDDAIIQRNIFRQTAGHGLSIYLSQRVQVIQNQFKQNWNSVLLQNRSFDMQIYDNIFDSNCFYNFDTAGQDNSINNMGQIQIMPVTDVLSGTKFITLFKNNTMLNSAYAQIYIGEYSAVTNKNQALIKIDDSQFIQQKYAVQSQADISLDLIDLQIGQQIIKNTVTNNFQLVLGSYQNDPSNFLQLQTDKLCFYQDATGLNINVKIDGTKSEAGKIIGVYKQNELSAVIDGTFLTFKLLANDKIVIESMDISKIYIDDTLVTQVIATAQTELNTLFQSDINLSVLKQNVDTNIVSIAANLAAITSNDVDISGNLTTIQQNTADIATLQGQVASAGGSISDFKLLQGTIVDQQYLSNTGTIIQYKIPISSTSYIQFKPKSRLFFGIADGANSYPITISTAPNQTNFTTLFECLPSSLYVTTGFYELAYNQAFTADDVLTVTLEDGKLVVYYNNQIYARSSVSYTGYQKLCFIASGPSNVEIPNVFHYQKNIDTPQAAPDYSKQFNIVNAEYQMQTNVNTYNPFARSQLDIGFKWSLQMTFKVNTAGQQRLIKNGNLEIGLSPQGQLYFYHGDGVSQFIRFVQTDYVFTAQQYHCLLVSVNTDDVASITHDNIKFQVYNFLTQQFTVINPVWSIHDSGQSDELLDTQYLILGDTACDVGFVQFCAIFDDLSTYELKQKLCTNPFEYNRYNFNQYNIIYTFGNYNLGSILDSNTTIYNSNKYFSSQRLYSSTGGSYTKAYIMGLTQISDVKGDQLSNVLQLHGTYTLPDLCQVGTFIPQQIIVPGQQLEFTVVLNKIEIGVTNESYDVLNAITSGDWLFKFDTSTLSQDKELKVIIQWKLTNELILLIGDDNYQYQVSTQQYTQSQLLLTFNNPGERSFKVPQFQINNISTTNQEDYELIKGLQLGDKLLDDSIIQHKNQLLAGQRMVFKLSNNNLDFVEFGILKETYDPVNAIDNTSWYHRVSVTQDSSNRSILNANLINVTTIDSDYTTSHLTDWFVIFDNFNGSFKIYITPDYNDVDLAVPLNKTMELVGTSLYNPDNFNVTFHLKDSAGTIQQQYPLISVNAIPLQQTVVEKLRVLSSTDTVTTINVPDTTALQYVYDLNRGQRMTIVTASTAFKFGKATQGKLNTWDWNAELLIGGGQKLFDQTNLLAMNQSNPQQADSENTTIVIDNQVDGNIVITLLNDSQLTDLQITREFGNYVQQFIGQNLSQDALKINLYFTAASTQLPVFNFYDIVQPWITDGQTMTGFRKVLGTFDSSTVVNPGSILQINDKLQQQQRMNFSMTYGDIDYISFGLLNNLSDYKDNKFLTNDDWRFVVRNKKIGDYKLTGGVKSQWYGFLTQPDVIQTKNQDFIYSIEFLNDGSIKIYLVPDLTQAGVGSTEITNYYAYAQVEQNYIQHDGLQLIFQYDEFAPSTQQLVTPSVVTVSYNIV